MKSKEKRAMMMENKEELQFDIAQFGVLLFNLNRKLEQAKEPHFRGQAQQDAFKDVSLKYNFNALKNKTPVIDSESIIGTKNARALLQKIGDWLDHPIPPDNLLNTMKPFKSYLDNANNSMFTSAPITHSNLTDQNTRLAFDIANYATKLTEILNKWDKNSKNGLNSIALRVIIKETLGLEHRTEEANATPT